MIGVSGAGLPRANGKFNRILEGCIFTVLSMYT